MAFFFGVIGFWALAWFVTSMHVIGDTSRYRPADQVVIGTLCGIATFAMTAICSAITFWLIYLTGVNM